MTCDFSLPGSPQSPGGDVDTTGNIDADCIQFVGDVMLGRGVSSVLTTCPYSLVAPDVTAVLSGCRYTCGNLESPITRTAQQTRPNGLCAGIEAARYLQLFDCLNLANNHIYDCGDIGIQETLKILEENAVAHTGISEYGHPPIRPIFVDGATTRFAIVGCTSRSTVQIPLESRYLVPYIEDDAVQDAICALTRKVDAVIVLLHGGFDYVPFPPPALRKLLHRLARRGVRLIVTHHPHVLGGPEQVGGQSLVWHSIGDFIFDSGVPSRRRSGILRVYFRRGAIIQVELIPLWITSDIQVSLAPPALASEILGATKAFEQTVSAKDYDRRFRRLYWRSLFQFQLERLRLIWLQEGAWQAVRFVSSRMRHVGKHVRRVIRQP